MKLSELLKTIQPVQVTGSTEKDITGVNIDSRLVAAGHLFMAMRGTQTDGHAYIPAAIEKGAIAVLCEDMPEEPTHTAEPAKPAPAPKVYVPSGDIVLGGRNEDDDEENL